MNICPNDSIPCLLRALLSDNTTNTLLQELLSANSQFNWDPLSFGVTAAIGVLAFLVSLTTVFQGLLAANSGRIKAGYAAIGPFAKQSRSYFNFEEFRLRTTCYVPFITIRPTQRDHQVNWAEAMNESNYVEKRGRKQRSSYILRPFCRRFRKLLLGGKPSSADDFNATWMMLLARLNLGRDHLWSLVKRDTDYLPSDISAAPAVARSKDLALLAVIAEDHSTVKCSSDGRYPIVDGYSSRLTFQNHPYLGPVGLYELLKPSQHVASLVFRDEAKYDFNQPGKSDDDLVCQNFWIVLGLALGNMLFDGEICRVLESNSDDPLKVAAKLQRMASFHPFFKDEIDHITYQDAGICFEERRELMLLCSDMPALIRGFPILSFGLYSAVKNLLRFLCSLEQSPAHTRKHIIDDFPFIIERIVKDQSEVGKLETYDDPQQYHGSLENFIYTTWMRPTHKKGYRYDPVTIASLRIALHGAVKWLREIDKSTSPFTIHIANEDSPISVDHLFVKDTLLKIDKYLFSKQKQASYCALWIVSRRKRRLAFIDGSSEDRQGQSSKELTAISEESDKFLRFDIEGALFCRALLFAAYLNTKTDTSILLHYHPKLVNTVVKVL